MKQVSTMQTRKRGGRLVLTLALAASLAANLVMAAFIGLAISTRSSFTDMARKVAKFTQLPPVGRWQPNRDYQRPLPCDLANSVVVLVLGQSNAANAAFAYTRAQDEGARAFQDGVCYDLSDPVVGGDGSRGSQWPRFADLFKERFGRSVTIISAAWGGSSVGNWSDNGYDRFGLSQVAAVKAAGGKIDAVFWEQGEQDYATDPAVYKQKFGNVMQRLRAAGVTAPILVAQATLSNKQRNEPVRQAQSELARQPGFFPGPDADSVSDRFDPYHFSAGGLPEIARLWLQAVVACSCLDKK